MGWADCGVDSNGRPIGYAFRATCDQSGCDAKIDRGLAYACGDMHGEGSEEGDTYCEKYFCYDHLKLTDHGFRCEECCAVIDESLEDEHARNIA